MNFDDYQRAAARTADPSQPTTDRLTNGALGIGGEAGEVIELVKKHRYHGDELGIDPLCKELGDLLWYISEMASAVGVSLGAIARTNIKKLRARYPDGFEKGGGIRDNDRQWFRPDMDARETFAKWPAPCEHVIVGDPDTYPNQRDCDRCGHLNAEH
jgi:NTP pyrophosphatase (non-canonical NTP hydrolase)